MRIIALFAAALAVHAVPALAHPNHDAETDAPRPASAVARDHIVRLVTQAKLPASWANVKAETSAPRTVKGANQTVVTFQNPAEKTASRRTFYVVVDSDGNIVSADHVLK